MILSDLEKKINYTFKNEELLDSAMTHSSLCDKKNEFERLEFLGDRILGIVVAEYLYKNTCANEGYMAKMHSSFICAQACFEIAKNIDIDKIIKTAGQELTKNKTVLADAVEALLGAVFIDAGFDVAKNLILNLWKNIFKNYDESKQEIKTQLQEICQLKTFDIPKYELLSMTGPDHSPIFEVSVSCLGQTAFGEGKSKKEAETKAAGELLKILTAN